MYVLSNSVKGGDPLRTGAVRESWIRHQSYLRGEVRPWPAEVTNVKNLDILLALDIKKLD